MITTVLFFEVTNEGKPHHVITNSLQGLSPEQAENVQAHLHSKLGHINSLNLSPGKYTVTVSGLICPDGKIAGAPTPLFTHKVSYESLVKLKKFVAAAALELDDQHLEHKNKMGTAHE